MNYTKTLILTCAGKGERAGKQINKLLVNVDGKNCIERAILPFVQVDFDEYLITSSKEDFEAISAIAKEIQTAHPQTVDKITVVLGGQTRSQSVKNALEQAKGQIVLIHDGARPFITKEEIERIVASVIENGSGIAVTPSPDTICKGESTIGEYLGKSGLYKVQTPQGFFTQDILKAYQLANGETFNDDGEVYKRFIKNPAMVQCSQNNIKITYPEDFNLLCENEYRFGVGFDCHRLVEGRKLILGGIELEHDKGLLGHSDADVLTHAIMDAILSAAAMRDIGYWFSDKDPKYKDADSMKLLEQVIQMIQDNGYEVKSISATVMAEKPKLLKHIPTITQNLANALSLPLSSLGIGATTLEGLGFVGREEGICVHATATLQAKRNY